MSKVRYFAYRTGQTILMLLLVVTFLFFLFRLMPGDVTQLMLYQGASPETVAAFKAKWGLDQPIYIQYLTYIGNLLSGELGTSLQYKVPVWEYVRVKIFNSFILVAPGITAGYIVGSAWGTVVGSTDRSKLEQYGIALAIFIGTIPIFFLGIVAIIIFAAKLNLVPSSGMLSPDVVRDLSGSEWWRIYLTRDFAIHYILPFSVIMLRYTYLPTLLMRTSITEVMGQGFSYYHRVTGLPKWRKLRHLAKHASLPVITFYPLSMTRALGGLVLVEIVFNWPGIGNALVQAVLFRDFPVVQFVFMIVAAFILFGNFVVDIVYGIIDPRVSIG